MQCVRDVEANDVLAATRNVGLGTIDEWTGTENNRCIMSSAHCVGGALYVLHALVMAHLLSNISDGGINVCGNRNGHWRWHDTENTEGTVVRCEIGRSTGFGGVP